MRGARERKIACLLCRLVLLGNLTHERPQTVVAMVQQYCANCPHRRIGLPAGACQLKAALPGWVFR